MQSFKRIQYDQQIDSEKNVERFENTQKNDNVIFIIAKSRKLLLQRFEEEVGSETNRLIDIDQASKILIEMLEKYKKKVDHQYMKQMIDFSRNKLDRNKVDYRFILDVFKAR